MAKFNNTIKNINKTTSYEGGVVYNKKVEEDWTNFIMSSMLEPQYYENSDSQIQRYIKLTEAMADIHGDEFIAKAAKYVRNELGMRSISQLTAAYLNDKKFDGKRQFYKNFCHRADDVAEIFAAIDMLGQKRGHATVRGCGDYLSSLNDYAIDKYKMNGHKYNMFDCINITHAKSASINRFKNDCLEKANTWEQKISACKSDIEKTQSWIELVESNSLGYLALIRNLRNIITCTDYIDNIDEWYVDILIPQIINKDAIHKSLIFPYQIYSAWKAIKNDGINRLDITVALDMAFRMSVENMPEMNGSTAILLDVSGSMEDFVSSKSKITLKECGAVYAAAIYLKNNDVTIIKFGNKAVNVDIKKDIIVFDIIKQIAANDGCGYATRISAAFNKLNHHADNLFIVSDMQIMDTNSYWYRAGDGVENYNSWAKCYGEAEVFSYDLANYSTQVANPHKKNVHLMTSLSPKVFDYIEILQNGVSIIDYIKENY